MRAQPFVYECVELAVVRLERLARLDLGKQLARPVFGLPSLPMKGLVVPVALAGCVLAHEDADQPFVFSALDDLAGAASLSFSS